MDDSMDPDAERLQTAAYASFGGRVRALLTDFTVGMAGLLAVVLLAALTTSVPGSGRLAVAALVALAVLYEPVMVWRFGGTVGHRRANLRVVHDATGGNPGLLRAFARFLAKGVLGPLSFTSMALTRRHQAMHDGLTGTTVRIRDLARAHPSDVRWEREIDEPAGLPSRFRRAAVIVAYVALSFVVLAAASTLLLPDACVVDDHCSAGEELTSWLLSLAWLGACAWLIIAGWRGRLWGCRPRVAAPRPGQGVPTLPE